MEKGILDEILMMLKDHSNTDGYVSWATSKLVFSELTIIPDQRRGEVNDRIISFTHYEFDMLLVLARHPRQVFTKKQIYEAVWDDIPISVDAKVECMIYSIRKKLRAYTDRQYIQTVWGVGYKFDPRT